MHFGIIVHVQNLPSRLPNYTVLVRLSVNGVPIEAQQCLGLGSGERFDFAQLAVHGACALCEKVDEQQPSDS
jgi:hypothetical protein